MGSRCYTPLLAGLVLVVGLGTAGLTGQNRPAVPVAAPCAIPPPGPADGLTLPPVLSPYPSRLAWLWMEGPGLNRPDRPDSNRQLRLRLSVGADGKVAEACVLDAVHPALASRVVESVKQHFSYHPATRSGRPVATVIAVTVPLVRAKPPEEVLADRSKDEVWRASPAVLAVRQSTDIAWLERLVVSEEAADDAAIRGRVGPKKLRVEAYARLGDLGTPAGLDALDRINRLARTRQPAADRFSRWAHPAWHFGDTDFVPLADVTAGGTTYAIVPANPYGRTELFVTWSRTPTTMSSWARPRLLNVTFWYAARDARLTAKEGVLELSYTQADPSAGKARETERPPDGPRHLRLVLADVTRDSDGDGWTDLEEQRLGLNPSVADTDGDGTVDGADVCPNLAAQRADVGEVPEIVQTAFAATFGLSGSMHRILAVHPTALVHFWGYAGPVIYGRSRPSALEAREGVYVEWEVVNRTPENATVIFEDWEGPLAAGGLNVYLKKMRGRWYVVAVRSTWIS